MITLFKIINAVLFCTFRHRLIVPHDSARLRTTAIRNLNLEPQDG